MTEKMINSIVFQYLGGSVDIGLTAVVLSLGVGQETNALYNWISPVPLMLVFMVLFNILISLCLFFAVPYVQKYQTLFLMGVYGFGFSRLIIGAGSGILTLAAAGMV